MQPVSCQKKFSASRRGFTLLEVLIVVVIAVVVTMFSVPAYKKAQDKNRYMAATGVLIDIANAARMVKADYPNLNVSWTLDGNASTAGECPDEPTGANLLTFLQCHKYLNDVPLSGGKYMGYTFVLSTNANAACGNSCKPGNASACMSGENRNSEYTCVWVDNSGLLHNTSI